MKRITTTKEMQDIELRMLKQLHSAFEKNDIKYCLGYGTLLGAIRHGGFIPWDDDVDIMMPRPDFENLRQNFKKIFEGTNLDFAFYDNKECYYPRPFAKIVDKRTGLIETNYDDNNEIGVFIDVFVVDGLPNNGILAKIHKNRCILLKKLCFASLVSVKDTKNRKDRILATIMHRINRDKLLKRLDNLCKKYDYNKSKYIVNLFVREDKKMEKGSFEVIKTKYCDAELFIPVDYEEILKNRYGNYMQLPPKNKRVATHPSNVYWK